MGSPSDKQRKHQRCGVIFVLGLFELFTPWTPATLHRHAIADLLTRIPCHVAVVADLLTLPWPRRR
jgi:hypothetical protein